MTIPCFEEFRSRRRARAGSRDYRAFVGPSRGYDLVGAMQFNLLTFLGLREHHLLLDIGCGSLRAGKLFIPYLRPGRYYGIEPEQWLVEEGIRNELGGDIIRTKQPVFSDDSDFKLSVFGREFDFILAHSIFSHTSEQQIKRCLSEAAKVMMPACLFAATFMAGESNYAGAEWVYPGCVTYSLEYLTGLVQECGLICRAIDWPHPNQQQWIVVVRPENIDNIPDISDITDVSRVESELRSCQERLSMIERHPYVRIGLNVRRFLQWIRR